VKGLIIFRKHRDWAWVDSGEEEVIVVFKKMGKFWNEVSLFDGFLRIAATPSHLSQMIDSLRQIYRKNEAQLMI
jgi:hypothetical protein